MTAFIVGPDLVAVALSLLVLYAVPIWALVDVANHSRVAFYQAKSSRTAWIILLAVGMALEPIGLILGVGYLAFTRRRVRRFDADAPV